MPKFIRVTGVGSARSDGPGVVRSSAASKSDPQWDGPDSDKLYTWDSPADETAYGIVEATRQSLKKLENPRIVGVLFKGNK